MNNYLECTPAYGRDYKSAKEVKAAWQAGKDWIIRNWDSQWDGKPINKQDADREGVTVLLRYKRNTQVLPIKPGK